MNDVIINVNEKNGVAYKKYCNQKLGNQHQNLQNKLKFEFADNIPEGIAWLEYEIDGNKNYALMEKYEKGYQIDIKSCLLVSDSVDVDLKITQEENPNGIPIFVSSIVIFEVERTINAEDEEPEQYPSWFDNAIKITNEVSRLDLDVSKVGDTSTITITKKDGTQKIVEVYDGTGGSGTGGTGENGATFTPSVSEDGIISWTNDKGLDNPSPINIKGPKGDVGEKGNSGNDGISVSSIIQTTTSSESGGTNIITATLSDGSTSTFNIMNGAKGDRGEKGDTGQDGYTPIKGVDYFDGEQGPQGIQGEQGIPGEQGPAGNPGKSATIQIGSVTTLDAGSQATVSNVGTENEAIFNFGIPKGEPGSGGTTDYIDLLNKPTINNVELNGNKTLDELGIQPKGDYASSSEIPKNLSDLNNDVNFLSSIPSEYITENELLYLIQQGTLNKNYNKLPSDLDSINLYTLESGVYQVDDHKHIFYSSTSINSLEDNFQPYENTDVADYLFPGDLFVHHKETNSQGVVTVNSFSINTEFMKSIVYDGTNEIEELDIKFMYWNDLGSKKSEIEPLTDDIPKVFINGSIPTDKTDVLAEMTYISKTEEFHSYIKIKCQGTSSMSYPKKNFTIKMFSDEERSTKLKKNFKGWGNQNKFCLKANYIDHSHARNIISANLWSEVVASRSNYNDLPEELRTSPRNGAIDGFPIKVYTNGTYQGIYTWNIPKDGWMTNMDDSLDTHCILCGENYVSGCFRSTAIINGSDWSDELHDTVPSNIITSFNNAINHVMNSTDTEFKTNLSNYFDINSLIDYYIFQYVICGLDSMGKNQLYFTYDGTHWIASSYDMDSTFGLYWNGSRFVSTEYRMQEDYESMLNGYSGNLLYQRLEENFVDEIKERYSELRTNVLTFSNIVTKFERFVDLIGNDLYDEDVTIYTGIPSKTTNNITQIRNYIRDRLIYVDTQIEILNKSIACTGITLNTNTLSFTDTTTQTLIATVEPSDTTDTITWESNDTTVAKVNEGVVTPKNNGTCVITATCGSQSATCNVTVSGLDEPVEEETILVSNYTADGTGFLYTNEIDFENEYIEASIDLTNETRHLSNILSIGENASSFDTNILHFYYSKTNSMIKMYLNMSGEESRSWDIAYTDTSVKIKLTKEGVFINDELFVPGGWIEVYNTRLASLLSLTTVQIGSKEGKVLSMATYNYIKIIRNTILDTNLLYSLPEKTGFSSLDSDYIDTGIQLFDEDKDFTIFIDLQASPNNNTIANLFHSCLESTGYPGISINGWGTNNSFRINFMNSTYSTGISRNDTGRYRVALIHTKDNNSLTVKGDFGETIINGSTSFTAFNQTLLLGCSQTTDGTKGRFWNGTIHDFKIYNRVLEDTELDSLLNPIEVIPEDSILYELPEETIFTSSDSTYIDTGIQLMKDDIDFSIVLDFTGSDLNANNNSMLFHCIDEVSPYPGLCFHVTQNIYLLAYYNGKIYSEVAYNDTERHKFVFTHYANTNVILGKNDGTTDTYAAARQTSVDKTLLLGCYQTTDGTKGRFWNGTIHDFKIYNRVLTDEEINSFLGISS